MLALLSASKSGFAGVINIRRSLVFEVLAAGKAAAAAGFSAPAVAEDDENPFGLWDKFGSVDDSLETEVPAVVIAPP